MVTPEAAEAAN